MEVVLAASQGRGLRIGLRFVLGQLLQLIAVASANCSVVRLPVCVFSYSNEPSLDLSRIRRSVGDGCPHARYRPCTGNDRPNGFHRSKGYV